MKFKNSENSKYLTKRNALILLIIGSLLSILLTPISDVKQDVIGSLPWVGFGTLITESLFVIGLGLIAFEAGHELGRNPFVWRRRLHRVIIRMVNTKLFWIGFWINAAGAVGTAVIVSVGVINALPPQSWGLLWVPLADLGFTIAIRTAALVAIEESK